MSSSQMLAHTSPRPGIGPLDGLDRIGRGRRVRLEYRGEEARQLDERDPAVEQCAHQYLVRTVQHRRRRATQPGRPPRQLQTGEAALVRRLEGQILQ